MPRFSAHITQLFTERPFAERFAAAAKAGFVACEFRSPFEHTPAQLAAWSRQAALPIILFNAPAGNWAAGDRGVAALPGRETEFDDSLDRAIRYADLLDVPMVHMMAGKLPAGADRDACRAIYISNLRAAARLFALSGRRLMIEAINHVDSPGYFLSTQAEAHAIRDEVGEPNLCVQMDCYHTAMTEGAEAIEPLLEAHIPTIGHIQIAGAPGRHEPDTGALDYARVFATIDRLPYEGWVGCEYVPAGATEAGLGWMKTLVEPARSPA